MSQLSPFYELKNKDIQRLKACSATTAVKIRKRLVTTLRQQGYNEPQKVTIFRFAHLEGASLNDVIQSI